MTDHTMAMKCNNALLLLMVSALLLLCLAEGRCEVQNKSSQVVVLEAVNGARKVEVAVGATVILEAEQQLTYVRNKHTGHQKGPIMLASGGVYVCVDAKTAGKINFCEANALGIGLSIFVHI